MHQPGLDQQTPPDEDTPTPEPSPEELAQAERQRRDQERLNQAQEEESRLLSAALREATEQHLQSRVLNLSVGVQQRDDRIAELEAQVDSLLGLLADAEEPGEEGPTP